MDIKGLSSKYVVEKLQHSDIHDIYNLCQENKLYYEYCPPMVSEESIKKDMTTLPPDTKMDDKYYIGFYAEGKLIAIMDLIAGYPEKNIAYIGFFMTDVSIQKRGIGSEIISEVCDHLRQQGFAFVRLAWVKGNPQAEHFWLKNGFSVMKETTSNVADSVILAERCLIS